MIINSKTYPFILFMLILVVLPFSMNAQKGYELVSKKGQFTVTFPGKPNYSSEDVGTAVGDLIIHTFLYEESANAAYMVAYIDYPEDIIEDSDNDILLDAAFESALKSWGINPEKAKKETTWHSGYKGVFAKESYDGTYTAYEVFLVGNRLYQLAILHYGKAIPKKSLSTFYDSFTLHE